MSEFTFLIATVGGSHEPVVKSVLEHRPGKVLFVVSAATRPLIEREILPSLNAGGFTMTLACYDCQDIGDAEDFDLCVSRLVKLGSQVRQWQARSSECAVVVDFTGGTKCMSAALALVARNWNCEFSYVGGQSRTRDGVGVVESGQERIVVRSNPWNSLARQTMEEACSLFNNSYIASAFAILNEAQSKGQIKNATANREVAALRQLIHAYRDWDCFDHKNALNNLEREIPKWHNDLRAVFQHAAEPLLDRIELNRRYLQELVKHSEQNRPSQQLVWDLFANACRRLQEGRYDDAVARLYRAIEALAQVALWEEFQIATDSVPLAKLPLTLLEEWKPRAQGDTVKLGLQDAYSLLRAFDHPLGGEFQQLELAGPKSPLSARNGSILAHGFTPVGEPIAKALREKFQRLAAGITGEGVDFPKLDLP